MVVATTTLIPVFRPKMKDKTSRPNVRSRTRMAGEEKKNCRGERVGWREEEEEDSLEEKKRKVYNMERRGSVRQRQNGDLYYFPIQDNTETCFFIYIGLGLYRVGI